MEQKEPRTADQEFVVKFNKAYKFEGKLINEVDLSGLTEEQVSIARNEIFARHGRIFVTKEIAAYFSAKSWYHGTISAAAFSETVFNEYERANVAFISQDETKHWGGSYY